MNDPGRLAGASNWAFSDEAALLGGDASAVLRSGNRASAVLRKMTCTVQDEEAESGETQAVRKSRTEDSAMKPSAQDLEDSPLRPQPNQDPPPLPSHSPAQPDADLIDPKTPDRPITRS